LNPRLANLLGFFMEIHMKKCSCCKEQKEFVFFNIDKTNASGYSTYCKPCKKQKDRVRQLTRIVDKAKKKQWRKDFPERKNAQSKVYRALLSGKLTKQPCFLCGEIAEAHHPDYSRPLDVVWLCAPHHRQAHAIATQ
jgi:hypothetical protein